MDRLGAVTVARGFEAARFADLAFDVLFVAFGLFLAFALLFGLAARRLVLGRLAERATFLRFLTFLAAGFRPALLRLAMTDAPSEP